MIKPTNSTYDTAKSALMVGAGFLTAYCLFDAGISNILALNTLRHGTSINNYFKIQFRGANPSYGGGDNGSIAAIGPSECIPIVREYQEHSKNYFHMFKDICPPNWERAENFPAWFLMKRINPKFFSVRATFTMLGTTAQDKSVHPRHPEIRRLTWRQKTSVALGLLTPTVKIRFNPESMHFYGLEDDPDTDALAYQSESGTIKRCKICQGIGWEHYPNYHGYPAQHKLKPDEVLLAYRTRQHISIWHLGITGSLIQGINPKMVQRMIQNPMQVLYGLLLCGSAIKVASYTKKCIHNDLAPTL